MSMYRKSPDFKHSPKGVRSLGYNQLLYAVPPQATCPAPRCIRRVDLGMQERSSSSYAGAHSSFRLCAAHCELLKTRRAFIKVLPRACPATYCREAFSAGSRLAFRSSTPRSKRPLPASCFGPAAPGLRKVSCFRIQRRRRTRGSYMG